MGEKDVVLTEESPPPSSSLRPTSAKYRRSYGDDIIASTFPHSALFMEKQALDFEESEGKDENATDVGRVERHNLRIRLDEWIKVIVLVRSYLLFWRNNPSRNLNSSCQDSVQRSVPRGSPGCVEILLTQLLCTLARF